MVKAGLGVSVLPHGVVAPHLESEGLSAIRIRRKGIRRTWFAASLKNKELPAYMTVFIRNLSKHVKQSEALALPDFA